MHNVTKASYHSPFVRGIQRWPASNTKVSTAHDDVLKWKHFPCYWPIWAGNSPFTGEFPAQRLVTQSFDVFFDLRLNTRLSKHSRGWWFRSHSDFIVMAAALLRGVCWGLLITPWWHAILGRLNRLCWLWWHWCSILRLCWTVVSVLHLWLLWIHGHLRLTCKCIFIYNRYGTFMKLSKQWINQSN